MTEKTLYKQRIVEELKDFGFVYKERIKQDKYASYHHVLSKKDFMAKIYIKKDIFKNQHLKKQMNREYKIGDLIKKNFSYLIGFHDFFYTKTFAVFIYEYCRSGTLEFLMGSSSLLEDNEKKIIIKDIYQGLEELRFLGIIHRNLNASCIYLSKFSLKIGGYEFCEENDNKKMDPADFRFFEENVENYETVAPELHFNLVPTLKTPLYSFGVIIYQLFHEGNYHVKERSLKELKHRYINKDYQIRISNSVDNIRGRTKIRPVLYGLLRVNVKERMSFVDLREFIGLIHKDIKSKEEEMRYTFLNRRKHIEKALSLKSSKTRTKRIRGAKSSKVLPLFLKKPTLSRTIPDFAKLKKTLSRYDESFMNQSIKLINTFKIPDPDQAVESKDKYPIPARFKFEKPSADKDNKKRMAMWRSRESLKFRKTRMSQLYKIDSQPVKLTKNQTFYSKKMPIYTGKVLDDMEMTFEGENTSNSYGFKTFFSTGFPKLKMTLDGGKLKRSASSKPNYRRRKFRVRRKNQVIV